MKTDWIIFVLFFTTGAFGFQTPEPDELRTVDISPIASGRLTLTSGTAVTTSDVTAAPAIFYTPFRGNKISLYDGSSWKLYAFSELSIGLTATSGRNYDVFIYNNSGTPALELSAAWNVDGVTRTDALTLQDGIYVKSGAATRRYLGTFRASASNVTEDSTYKRFLWNYYNRVQRRLYVGGSGAGYTYNTASWRSQNGDAAVRIEIVFGLAEDSVHMEGSLYASNSGGNVHIAGICQSCTNSVSGHSSIGYATHLQQLRASFSGAPLVGYYYYQLVEYGGGAGTTTWYGDGPSGYGFIQGAIRN